MINESCGEQLCHVFVEALSLPVHIGIYPEEKGAAQPVVFDLDIGCRVEPGVRDDDVDGFVDYETYCALLAAFLEEEPHTELLEQLVVKIAAWSFARMPAIESIRIRAHKAKVRQRAARMGVAFYWTRLDYVRWCARPRASALRQAAL